MTKCLTHGTIGMAAKKPGDLLVGGHFPPGDGAACLPHLFLKVHGDDEGEGMF